MRTHKRKKKDGICSLKRYCNQCTCNSLCNNCQQDNAQWVWLLHCVNWLPWTTGLIVNSNDFNLFLKTTSLSASLPARREATVTQQENNETLAMETDKEHGRCHRCLNVGAFLEIYFHLSIPQQRNVWHACFSSERTFNICPFPYFVQK